MTKKVSFHNLGCKVNSYETQVMAGLFEDNGYTIVDFNETADICIINTCTVTNIADRKSRQMLHKAKKMNPDAFIVAVGCYVQADPQKAASDEAVDLVIGNTGKGNIVEIVENALAQKNQSFMVTDINAEKNPVYENMHLIKPMEHTRAAIKIQDGCNQFCTYCLIPYVRGRIRSRTIMDILDEVRTIANQGYKELVITGIHISSYGRDFEDDNVDLLDLLKAIHETDGIERIRLGSLEPGIITEQFAKELVKLNKVCPHFHLSLQSGCDSVLKRMNRKYTTEQFKKIVEILRSFYDRPAITTDVICGFPKESEEEFQMTHEFLKDINFYETHIFPYSKRQGTIAASMDGQIRNSVKSERCNVLQSLNLINSKHFRCEKIGKEEKVLFEEYVKINDTEYQVGYTSDYVKVAVISEKSLTNTIRNVEIKDFIKEDILIGELC